MKSKIYPFKVGDKVKTCGDMGGLSFTIIKIHNDHYCTAKGYGKNRHFNMKYFELNLKPL